MSRLHYLLIATVAMSLQSCGGGSSSNSTPPSQVPATPLAIASSNPPSGVIDNSYAIPVPCGATGNSAVSCIFGFPLSASGGKSPYSWSWVAASGSTLPPGLGLMLGTVGVTMNLAPVGGTLIEGTPTAVGTYNVVVTVTDAQSPPKTASANYAIVINPPAAPVITPPAVIYVAVHQAYNVTFTAQSDVASLPLQNWAETGSLPAGVTFNNGTLSGVPTVSGMFPIRVDVQDSYGQTSAPLDFVIQIYPHGFYPTGPSSSSFMSQLAALLPNGKILFAGGLDDSQNTLGTAQLYDPVAQSFTSTGNLITPLSGYVSTLLQNGTVLLIGGFDSSDSDLATTEFYDPATGTFSSSGSMATSRRFGFTATLLNNGKVLVVGGLDSSGNGVATAELYDPGAGAFTATGNLVTARSQHTATLLSDGRVLIAGGAHVTSPQTLNNPGTSQFVPQAELYDPDSGTFSAVGNLVLARLSHTATLLPNGEVVLIGGYGDQGLPLLPAEQYNPATQTFSGKGSMMTARDNHTATLLNDGTVVVAGGIVGSPGNVNTAELYDAVSGMFSPTGGMSAFRIGPAATLLPNGTVLITGGVPSLQDPAAVTAELYK
jgi:hypothetical protein